MNDYSLRTGGISIAAKRAYYEYHGLEWPRCECHGMEKHWSKSSRERLGGSWGCAERRRERGRRDNASEKGRAYLRRRARTEKERERKRRYAASHVQIRIGRMCFTYPVPPEKKEAARALLSEFRAGQSADYAKEAESGWIG